MNEKLLNQIYFNSVANQNCKDFLISNSSRSSKKFSNSTSEILEITFQIFKNKLKCTEEKKANEWKRHVVKRAQKNSFNAKNSIMFVRSLAI